ncbi:unnamed protein product, partial [Musa hybrid cultivar]
MEAPVWRSSAAVLGLVVAPKLVHSLPQEVDEEVVAVSVLHLGVQLRHEAALEIVAVVEEPRRDVVALVPPVAAAGLNPVAGGVPGLQPHVVGDALDEAPVGGAAAVPLPHVRVLVVQHPHDLGPYVAAVSGDVVGAEVDGVAAGVGDAVHGLDDEGDERDVLAVGLRLLVEGGPDEGGGGGQHLLAVLQPDLVVEAGAAGGARRVVGGLVLNGAGRRDQQKSHCQRYCFHVD